MLLREHPVAIEAVLRQVETVPGLAVGGDGVADIGAAHVEQHVAFLHPRAGVDEDSGDSGC